ncbi:MAG: glycosyltransferase family 9 protein [Verrucomicrobiota bacterium]|nr:glycosyltransferase family 9 protein [Verrucomicrobiota bacterium]
MRDAFMYYQGIGDALLLSTVLYHRGKAQPTNSRVWVGTNYPEIYQGNPFVQVLPGRTQHWGHRLIRLMRICRLVKPFSYIDYYHKGIPKAHLLTLLSERIGLHTAPITPVYFPTENERRTRLLPQSTKPVVIMQSTGNTAWTDNKNWGSERFCAVAKLLAASATLVQIGRSEDPPLEGALNLCGRLTIRQCFQVLAEGNLFIGQVGFLMHAAAAVSTPGVIVYGGFEAPWQSGYEANVNLYTTLECSPCWLQTRCPYEKKCLTQITPELVAASARHKLSL